MEKNAVIDINNLKIDYRNLNHISIQQIIRNPALKGRGMIHAVRELNLTVSEGEILGIIGPNGAGKSTLLKAVAGIFQPDEGSIDTHGKRVSLMSLGVGFKWELSGRENIMIAGLLLHYQPSYIRSKMQEIIDFSELGDDIDRPIRTYSSGMYSKLSFAITAVLETDIMLIDELLSVGDEQFQTKSYNKIRSLVQSDRTTSLIVSHDMDLLRSICTRVIWMHKGRIMAAGEPDNIIDMYVQWSAEMGALPLKVYDDFLTAKEDRIMNDIALFRGLDVNETTGKLMNATENAGFEQLSIAVNWEPFEIGKGTSITPISDEILFRIFAYRKKINDMFVYTPCTSTEGNKTTFDPEASALKWHNGEMWEAPYDMYIRISVMKKNGRTLPADMFLKDMIRTEEISGCSNPERTDGGLRDQFIEEAAAVAERVQALTEEGDAVLMVLADSHFAFGGTWEDTVFCLQQVSRLVHPDCVVNLGDITDGRYPQVIDKKLLGKIGSDMRGCGCPLYVCPGNHDIHRFAGTDKVCTSEEVAAWTGASGTGSHFTDIEEQGIRMIFLESFDMRRDLEYGYSDDELSWLSDVLEQMPEDYKAVVFSHVNPSEDRTKWDEEILNSGKIREVLNKFAKRRKGSILGMICGHDHEDRIRTGLEFPIVSMGCALLEDHKGTRPLYDGKYTRKAGMVSQELFDVMIIKKNENRLHLIRFGAGEDRYAEVK